MRCELFDLKKSVQDAAAYIAEKFIPILTEFWQAHGHKFYGTETWSPGLVEGFYGLIQQRILTLITAFDDVEQPSGFILGIPSIHLLTNRTAFIIECWYGRTPAIENMLFQYLDQGLRFMKVNHLVVPKYSGHNIPEAAHNIFNVAEGDRTYMCRGFNG
jgi:hypothetical protein